jgi:predicted negative regulator of RcsB-dependent stress response
VSDRLTKHDLKVDPLIAQTGQTVDFVRAHTRLMVGAVVLVFIVAIGFVVVRATGRRAEETAAGMLAEARSDFNKGALDPAAARIADLQAFHGGTESGKLATLLLGDVRYAQGRYSEAEEAYRQAVHHFAKDPLLGLAARRGLAASLESEGRNQDAITVLKEILAAPVDDIIRADVQIDLARNELKIGNQEEAEKIYDEVSKDTSNPRAAQEAEMRLAEVRTLHAG